MLRAALARRYVWICSVALMTGVMSGGTRRAVAAEPVPLTPTASAILKRLIRDNEAFATAHPGAYFDRFRDDQKPAITLVGCADSRFQITDIDSDPNGDAFVVRNIGNQIYNSPGSVAYGVRHLHTPVLLVVGHVGCGAIKAALDDYTVESPAIRRDLDGLHLALRGQHPGDSIEKRWLDGVIANVHLQVKEAAETFAEDIKEGRLAVVGAVYDFRNDLGKGKGRLVIINVNGETDPQSLALEKPSTH